MKRLIRRAHLGTRQGVRRRYRRIRPIEPRSGQDTEPLADGCWTSEIRRSVEEQVSADLWQYLGLHARLQPITPMNQGAENLGPWSRQRDTLRRITGLPIPDLHRLAALQFVLSPQVATLLAHTPMIITRPGSARLIQTEHRGAVRGQPQWISTAQQRHRRGGDGSLFVTIAPHRRPAIELVLLHELLGAIIQATQLVLPRRTPDRDKGMAQTPHQPDDEPLYSRVSDADREQGWFSNNTWHAQVTYIREQCLRWRGETARALHGAPPSSQHISENARLLRAQRRSDISAQTVLAAYDLWHDLIESPQPATIQRIVTERVLMPLSADTLYELYILFAALRVAEHWIASLCATGDISSSRRIEQRLIPAHARPVAAYSAETSDAAGGRQHLTLHAYYQHTPQAWRMASHYTRMFAAIGLPVATRRPDIILELRIVTPTRRTRRWLLIEVKRTTDAAYIADSLYKVLGYIADFGAMFQHQQAGLPQAILSVWERPTTQHSNQDAMPVRVGTATTFPGILHDVLQQLIEDHR